MDPRLQRAVLALCLAGCEVAQPSGDDLDVCEIGQRTLALSHERLAFGAPTTMTVEGAASGEEVAFWWSDVEEPACTCDDQGCLELDTPVLLGTAVADEDGLATLELPLAPDEPVGPRRIQARGTGGISAVAETLVSGELLGVVPLAEAPYSVRGLGLGGPVAAVGDVDGDGRTELVAGIPVRGEVWIFEATTGRERSVGDLDDVIILEGPPSTGSALVGLGDVNNDGLADMLVGSPDTGEIWLVRGGLRPGRHDIREVASHTLQRAGVGRSLAAADIDGDGVLEPVWTDDHVVYLSIDGNLTAEDQVYGLTSPQVARAGDLDRDGLQDLVITSGDEIQIYFGAGFVERGPSLPDPRVAPAGDLDGDGLDDVVVSSPTAEEGRGVVTVMYGPINPLITVMVGTEPGDAVGTLATTAGDLNGDELADLIVTAPGAEYPVVVLYGPVGLERVVQTADVQLVVGDEPVAAGTGLAGHGDLDGDGYDDVVIGAQGKARGGFWIFRGAPGW